jgi:type II secretory pathway pseudopilin PulG
MKATNNTNTKNTNTKKNNSGFTLIETLVYIALFTIVIGGGLVGAYGVIEGTDRTSAKTILEQDANFILRKMDWALTGLDVINSSGGSLSVNKKDFSQNPIVFTLVGTDIKIKKAGNTAVILNNSRIKISNLLFTKVTTGGKDGIQATFTATTVNSKLSETFSITKYIRHE